MALAGAGRITHICRNKDLRKTSPHRFKCTACGASWALRWYPSALKDTKPILAAIYKNGETYTKKSAANPARGPIKRV